MGIQLYPGDTERPVCCTCLSTDRRRVFFCVPDGDGAADYKCHECTPDLEVNNNKQNAWPEATQVWLENCGGNNDLFDRFCTWVESLRKRPLVSDTEAAWCVMYVTNRVRPDSLSLATAAVTAFQKIVADKTAALTKKADEEASATGQWIGTKGGKVEDLGLLRCEKIISLGVHPEWGERFLLKFTTPEGYQVAWFTSAKGKFDPAEGDEYDIRAKVKDHTVYNGVKQTIISHAKERKADATNE